MPHANLLAAASLLLTAALPLGRSAWAGDTARPVEPLPELRANVPAAPPAPATWYGWQIILADAAAFACVGLTEQEGCLAGYALSGPAIHTLHGHPGRGAASLGLRILLPLVGGSIGGALANCPDRAPPPPPSDNNGHAVVISVPNLDLCGLSEMAMGVMVGAGAAMVADGIMAFSDGAPATATESNRVSRAAISPRLSVGRSNVALGIGGTF
jgi:hypothetical protein